MDKVERRDRPKSLGRTRGATLGTAVKALFGPYRSPHNDRIHLRSLAQTPFRTVSLRTRVNKGKRARTVGRPGPLRRGDRLASSLSYLILRSICSRSVLRFSLSSS